MSNDDFEYMSKDDYEHSMKNSFNEFENRLKHIEGKNFQCPVDRFAQQEMFRFYSIGGTVLKAFPDASNPPDQRNVTHPLLRTILEGWIWVSYIFWENDESTKKVRFNEFLNGFKIQYRKLIEDKHLPRKDELLQIPEGEDWKDLDGPMNAKDLLVSMKNDHGDRLDYLYFVYRVTSFDIHAKASDALFSEVFGELSPFTYINPDKIIRLLANHYLEILEQINS